MGSNLSKARQSKAKKPPLERVPQNRINGTAWRETQENIKGHHAFFAA
jgi:hypothetical protein